MNYTEIPANKLLNIKTLGALKNTGHEPLTIKEELRKNLIANFQKKHNVFEGIWGYEETQSSLT